MLDDFRFQLNKIDNIFFKMIDNMEEFLLEYIQLSRLLPTLFSTSSASELKVQFNNRVNKNIEEDINQCISHLCDWLLERSNRTVHQLNKHLNTSTIHSRKDNEKMKHYSIEIDKDFSISRQQILNQLQTQCQNVQNKKTYSKLFSNLKHSISVHLRSFINKKRQPVHKRMISQHQFVRLC